uniref:Ankyrin repeat and SOCS box containing 7 n=1 Tax=Gallus gallus TaxID=9031 RepID=A0A8V0Z859_CHICK
MLHHHCRRNPELQEELQIQAAVAAGDVHTVRKMLEQGYSPNGRDANGWTLLHFSAARGKERCVRVFLEHGAVHISRFCYPQINGKLEKK